MPDSHHSMAESIELDTIPTNASQADADPTLESSTRDQQDIDEEPAHATSLPPVDGGWRAWLFLMAATWIEVLVWGLPFAVGILHGVYHHSMARLRLSWIVYWTNTLFPGEGASTLTLAATLQTAFADDLSLTNPSGTALISILNAASIPGTTLLGYLSDHLPIGIVISISGGGGILIGFAVLFGLLGPSFAALWTGMIVVIAKDDLLAPPMIFSIFAICRGVGSLISGPISGALLKTNAMEGAPGAYGFQSY
ncbi:hypothetical protein B9479_004166 [Cryptococcus floricola]|uniref:Major facilitator superfamily (MFS) profile domain-containing protein n=1 Tax=Cryptococcus floricola TaxID=2591691 RepID=A0A5D3AXT0_9TREE|nr:hypothetical protein B9479_004166 [Cryptococcus floricola]